MKTEIFKDYIEFLSRKDKDVNGVSSDHAKARPDYETENASNKACWNCYGCSGCSSCYDCYGCSRCSDCSRCSGCSSCYDCYGCSRCSDCSRCSGCSSCYDCYGCSCCSGCSGCSDCSRCSGCSSCYDCYGCSCCSGCSGCSDCYGCSGCYGCSDCSCCYGKTKSQKPLAIPTIPSIHAAVLAACSKPDALDMGSWHTCETTHCRAGWVVTLAGEAGKALESKTSTLFAAMQIYKASSPTIRVFPPRFFEGNQKAMDDMKRCADEEAASEKGGAK